MVATSWSATAASVATAKSAPIADARPSTSRQPAGSRATRSAIVAVITGGMRSASSARGGAAVEEPDGLGDEQRVAPRALDQHVDVGTVRARPPRASAARARTSARTSGSSTTSVPSLRSSARTAPSGDDGGASSGPVGHQQAGPALAGGRREVHEQRHGGRVGPVSVVEHPEHRRARRGVADAAGDGVELGHPLGGRVAGVRRRAGQVAAVERAEHLPPRPQPRQRRRLRGGRPRDLPPLPLGVDEHGVAQRRLAHPGLARDEHHPADAARGAAAQLGDPAQRPVAPAQPRGRPVPRDHGGRVLPLVRHPYSVDRPQRSAGL